MRTASEARLLAMASHFLATREGEPFHEHHNLVVRMTRLGIEDAARLGDLIRQMTQARELQNG